VLCLDCQHGKIIPKKCDWRCWRCDDREICPCGNDEQTFIVALERAETILSGAVGAQAKKILKKAKERGRKMSLNGEQFDRAKAEVAECRAQMRRSREKGEHMVALCSPRNKKDRGYVGVMNHWFDTEIIPAAFEGHPITKEQARNVRLQVMSDLVGRRLSTSWDIRYFEIEGWNWWATAELEGTWSLMPGPAETMVMLATNEEFRRLVATMPKLEMVP
jgi:hypothetical protein